MSVASADVMLVAAFDPGLLTGACIARFWTGQCEMLLSEEVSFEEILDWSERYIPQVGHVVSEKFTITPQTGKNSQAPWSLRVEGVVISVAHRNSHTVEFQSPASAKSLVDNDMLRRLGMWHKGGEGHANDAIRHAVTYAVRHGWKDARLLPTDD